ASLDLLRLMGVRGGGLLKCGSVWPVRRHAVVQACAARNEAVRLGVIASLYKPHVLAGHVAVVPGWPKSIAHDQGARPEYDKIEIGGSRDFRGRGKHSEYAGVRVIEADRPYCVEMPQVVLVGGVIAVPCDHVQGRAIKG